MLGKALEADVLAKLMRLEAHLMCQIEITQIALEALQKKRLQQKRLQEKPTQETPVHEHPAKTRGEPIALLSSDRQGEREEETSTFDAASTSEARAGRREA